MFEYVIMLQFFPWYHMLASESEWVHILVHVYLASWQKFIFVALANLKSKEKRKKQKRKQQSKVEQIWQEEEKKKARKKNSAITIKEKEEKNLWNVIHGPICTEIFNSNRIWHCENGRYMCVHHSLSIDRRIFHQKKHVRHVEQTQMWMPFARSRRKIGMPNNWVRFSTLQCYYVKSVCFYSFDWLTTQLFGRFASSDIEMQIPVENHFDFAAWN